MRPFPQILAFSLALMLALPTTVRAEHNLITRQSSGTLTVLLSVSWHGDHMRAPNINALRELRRSHAGMPILHLIDPAYWTKKNANKSAVTAKLRSSIMPGDEVGLLLQPWRSLVQTAGVSFKTSPTFWGQDINLKECDYDCGREVPLTEYSADDVDKILQTALQQFAAAGMATPESAQVGGWLSSQVILEALAKQKITTDFSAVPVELVAKRLGRYPIFGWLKTRWQSITTLTPAYEVDTPNGTIVQAVANTAAMEFVTPAQTVALAQQLEKQGLLRQVVIHLNINQETAAEQMPRLKSTLQALQKFAADNKLTLQFLSLPLVRK